MKNTSIARLVLLATIFFSPVLQAANEPVKAKPAKAEKLPVVEEKFFEPPAKSETPTVAPAAQVEVANPWLVTGHFSYIDLMLPGKFGLAVGRGDSDKSMWEVEYTHGSLTPFFISDLGKFTEDRISLVQRSGSNNLSGFQWFYGVFYHRFKLEIGNALLNRLTTYYPSAEVMSISGIGGVIGIGYRWLASEHFLIGLDLVTYSQPFYNLTSEQKFLEVVTDPNDKDKVEAGLTAMKYFPRLGVAKIAIGYTF